MVSDPRGSIVGVRGGCSRPSPSRPVRRRPMRVVCSLLACVVVISAISTLSTPGRLPAQEGGDPTQDGPEAAKGQIYQRKVQLPQGPVLPSIVMTEFFTHGELDARGSNLAVHDGRRNPVPWRLLQV